MEEEESSSDKNGQQHAHKNLKLSQVVNDCVKRWFQDTLKEAKAGDSAMQVLVGQMYFSGYGVPRDPQKGLAWISKASKSRYSALHVGDKHPGYNASDSDSDKLKGQPTIASCNFDHGNNKKPSRRNMLSILLLTP